MLSCIVLIFMINTTNTITIYNYYDFIMMIIILNSGHFSPKTQPEMHSRPTTAKITKTTIIVIIILCRDNVNVRFT